MPQLPFSQVMTANGTANPVDGWQYEYLPYAAECTVLQRATTTGVRAVITSGSETIMEEAPVQGGGTAGTTPSPLNTPVQSWIGAAGDRIKIRLREVAAGTPTVDGILEINPL